MKKGFTMLELALSMAFLSFLLLAIGIVTVQLTHVYQKGITLKSVNSTGRELVDDFTRTISGSLYHPPEDGDFKKVYVQSTSDILERDGAAVVVPTNGAFCTGSYSYIWNTGYALNLPESDPERAEHVAVLEGYDQEIHLLKLTDPSRSICENRDSNDYEGGTDPVELLPSDDGGLILYDFVVYEPAYHDHTGHALFSASFILGTLSGNIDITVQGNYCGVQPQGVVTDFTYCSVNKFNFAARATGEAT